VARKQNQSFHISSRTIIAYDDSNEDDTFEDYLPSPLSANTLSISSSFLPPARSLLCDQKINEWSPVGHVEMSLDRAAGSPGGDASQPASRVGRREGRAGGGGGPIARKSESDCVRISVARWRFSPPDLDNRWIREQVNQFGFSWVLFASTLASSGEIRQIWRI
jgi:hypothetical protein